MSFNWTGKRVLVTGGASFISSHLIDRLVEKGATVRAVDDLSSGRVENIQKHLDSGAVELVTGDLRNSEIARQVSKGMELVFHLACNHGGRGYLAAYQAGPATNFHLDGSIFGECVQAGVEKIVFASTACVYPNSLQSDPGQEIYLSEDMVGPPYDADSIYGWAKLMAEMSLRAYHKDLGLKAAVCRLFTVYGPRAKEDHAVMAMIARNFVKQDPLVVWGTGEQVRCWTYIDDIVNGFILAAEKVDDGSAVNLGTSERIRVLDAMRFVMKEMGRDVPIETSPDMPTGPLNRSADFTRAKQLLGWKPTVLFEEGVRRTIRWYRETKKLDEVSDILQRGGLIERKVPLSTG